MKTFRLMKIEHTNEGPVCRYAGHFVAVDLAGAIVQAIGMCGPGHYTGLSIPYGSLCVSLAYVADRG